MFRPAAPCLACLLVLLARPAAQQQEPHTDQLLTAGKVRLVNNVLRGIFNKPRVVNSKTRVTNKVQPDRSVSGHPVFSAPAPVPPYLPTEPRPLVPVPGPVPPYLPTVPRPFVPVPAPVPPYRPAVPRPPPTVPLPSITPTGERTVLATLEADPDQFSTLSAALAAAGITDEEVAKLAPVTLFAPTNSAFAKIDNTTLAGLLADTAALTGTLQRHLVAGQAARIPAGRVGSSSKLAN